MPDVVDLERYPLHRMGSPEWLDLVDTCSSA